MNEVKIIGTGRYVPERVVTNDDLTLLVDTSHEWIYSRSGIKERRISEGQGTTELASNAALEALKDSGVKPEELDLIIVATASPDTFIPSTSCSVQAIIGAVNATAFDVSAACSGFLYGVNIATQFIRTGQCKNALVIGSEVLSKIIDWSDRNTCVLFGDGAGAIVLSSSQERGVISVYSGSDGSKGNLLRMSALPVENPYAPKCELTDKKVVMDGREVFKFATKIIEKSLEEVIKNTDISLNDIKYIVPHQANLRIIEYVSKRFDIDMGKFVVNLERYGNTSSASIPIAFDELVKSGRLQRGDLVVFVGFGGGLTWGAALIQY